MRFAPFDASESGSARIERGVTAVWRGRGYPGMTYADRQGPGLLAAAAGAEAPLPVHRRDAEPVGPSTWDDAVRLYRQGQYRAAALAFSLIARVGPQRQRALVAQASGLMNLGRFRRAIDLLERAVHRDPSDPIAAMNLATAQFRAGLLPEALAQACASVELFRMAGMSVARPRHLQGLIYLETGAIDRARRHLSDALAAEPTFVPAILGLAQCALAQRDLRRARRCLRRAQRLLKHAPEEVRQASAEAVERLASRLPAGAAGRWAGWLCRIARFRRRRRYTTALASTSPQARED